MRLIIDDLEIFVLVVKDRGWFAFENKLRQRVWRTAELQFHLLKMVRVNVAIAACPDEFADIQFALLRDHVGEQGIGRNIERHAEKAVGAALIKLTREFPCRNIELEK